MNTVESVGDDRIDLSVVMRLQSRIAARLERLMMEEQGEKGGPPAELPVWSSEILEDHPSHAVWETWGSVHAG